MEALSEAPRGPKSVVKACLPCRTVKMRCVVEENETICVRCSRKSLNCVFQDHRRGRKPGTRIAKRHSTSSRHLASTPPPEQTSSTEQQYGDSAAATAVQKSPDWDNETRGDDPAIPSDDPIQLGLVNLSIASSLFENFMVTLNPYISQLDPHLHSFSRVRKKSAFLLTVILAAAAKAFNPALNKKLRDHAEDMLADSFRRGSKSIETAQAIMIMTYWKDPEDTRAWIYLGYIIRMGMELGWHRLAPYSLKASDIGTDHEIREARNIERTWLVLFVYDRSMSLQTGKPWMIERSGFIESVEAWCKDPTAISNDRLLGALVTLRLLSSEVFRLLGSRSNRARAGQLHTLESLLAIINGRIEEWETRWLKLADQDSCHPFLIQFYGTHLRLQLFSLPLQETLGQPDEGSSHRMEALWVSYSSALEMLHLICRHSSWLYFAQDSVHVMTAYSAAFLIKLLMSAPESVTRQIEPAIKSAISGAAVVFSQQAAPPGSSCALQAKFLDNITTRFSKERPHIHGRVQDQRTTVGMGEQSTISTTQQNCDDSRWDSSETASFIAPMRGADIVGTGLTFESAEEATWANLIAEAGFSAQDGVFFG
ncbi:Protein priB [Colletotrichum siamense]|uniref:Protein priB n=1 Tax=Colletotrichum siamense TaxID=690259 RepID=UPI0018725B0C|nr:Protein priB [Colletotrichum siamense]KAF5504925.1 Protein priB [Colletotrichum siamense]